MARLTQQQFGNAIKHALVVAGNNIRHVEWCNVALNKPSYRVQSKQALYNMRAESAQAATVYMDHAARLMVKAHIAAIRERQARLGDIEATSGWAPYTMPSGRQFLPGQGWKLL